MAEEEKQQDDQQPEQEEQPEAQAEEQPQAEDAPAEGAAPEAEEAPAEDAAPAAEEAGASVDSGGEEVLSPKQRRRMERSRASGPPGPQRSAEERAAERVSRRREAAERRRRHRASRRKKHGEPATGTAPSPRGPGPKKVRQGTVVSAGADKTITVEIAVVRRHPTYEKVVRRTSRLHAHDEANEAQRGDVVRVIESRPLSRTKRWRLLDVLEKAR